MGITPLKEIWESPRVNENMTSVGFEPTTSGLDLPMLYRLSYEASGFKPHRFSLTRGDSQISFKWVIPKGDLVYRQYCLLPVPKHTLKIIISYFLGATWFPYYISVKKNSYRLSPFLPRPSPPSFFLSPSLFFPPNYRKSGTGFCINATYSFFFDPFLEIVSFHYGFREI